MASVLCVTCTSTLFAKETLSKKDKSAYVETLDLFSSKITTFEQALTSHEANPAQISFVDITGDGKQEMIFVCSLHTTNGLEAGELHIFTTQKGSSKELYSQPLSMDVAGGCDYVLFSTKENELFIYEVSEDESEQGTITQLSYSNKEIVANEYAYYGYNFSENVTSYRVQASTSDEATYTKMMDSILNNLKQHYASYLSGNRTQTKEINQNTWKTIMDSKESVMTLEDAYSYLGQNKNTKQSQSTPNTSSSSMLFENSSDVLLSDQDVAGYSSDQLQTAINEIYARHGYIFKTPSILEHFRQYAWYQEVYSDMGTVSSQLSDVEQKNIALFQKYMN